MSKEINKIKFLTMFFLIGLFMLTGCSVFGLSTKGDETLDVTQAYQTVEARLTQAIANTKLVTATQTVEEPVITPTNTTSVTGAPTFVATNTPIPPSATKQTACDIAAAGNPIDVTIPDNTVLQPGEAFTKVWRLVNVGTCTWTTDYSVAFFSGEQMSGAASVKLPAAVPPGATTEISIDLVAPLEAGTYQGDWKLKNAADEWFGLGGGGGSAFWVRIIVPEVTTTITPTVSATVQPTNSTPSVIPSPVVKISGSVQLNPSNTYDLDNAQLNPSGGADISYESTNSVHTLKAINNARIVVVGNTEPSIEDCQPANVTGTEVNLENISPGTFLCVTTDVGSPGWITFSSLDDVSGILSLQFLIWQTP